MSKFISYQNLDFKLGNQLFYATQVSISAQASVSPILVNDGTLLNYAPDSAVVGSLSCDFYLTGSLPSFLNITGSSEAATTATFANVNIAKVYPKSLSFSVEPFRPILISAEFDWYGTMLIQNITAQTREQQSGKAVPNYIANGYKSYLDASNIEDVGSVLSFAYSASADRPSYFKVGEKTPFRVCKMNKKASIKLSSDNLGDLIDIEGTAASAFIYLKDLYGQALDSFYVTGRVINQEYSVQEGQYLIGSIDVIQEQEEEKTLV